jgi:hypothetical protein
MYQKCVVSQEWQDHILLVVAAKSTGVSLDESWRLRRIG